MVLRPALKVYTMIIVIALQLMWCMLSVYIVRCIKITPSQKPVRENSFRVNKQHTHTHTHTCLLYTSDAADDC